jgi:hypothetical protein
VPNSFDENDQNRLRLFFQVPALGKDVIKWLLNWLQNPKVCDPNQKKDVDSG